MKAIGSFLFYAIYLLAAELPLFLVLILRSWDIPEIKQILICLLLVSIFLNLIIFVYLLTVKPLTRFKETITDIDEKTNNQNISEFFSFFLLPFFTFSLSTSSEPKLLFSELAILFVLLTIYLYKTKNLTSNIFIFLLFNIYSIKTKGNSCKVLMFSPQTFDSFSDNQELIKVNRNYYIFYGDQKKRFKITLLVLSILLFLILSFLVFKLYLYPQLIN